MSEKISKRKQGGFREALEKYGFVSIPRMVLECSEHLELNYDTIGKLFVLLGSVGESERSIFGTYSFSPQSESDYRYKQLRDLVVQLADIDVVQYEEDAKGITFSFGPLCSRLEVMWSHCGEPQLDVAAEKNGPTCEVVGPQRKSGDYQRIVRYLGLGRSLTEAEQGLLGKWMGDWGFSEELIIRAAEAATGARNPLQYMNRVLECWKAKGIKTVVDVEQLQSEYRAQLNTESGRRPGKSNVLLRRKAKDDAFYEHLYKKFED